MPHINIIFFRRRAGEKPGGRHALKLPLKFGQSIRSRSQHHPVDGDCLSEGQSRGFFATTDHTRVDVADRNAELTKLLANPFRLLAAKFVQRSLRRAVAQIFVGRVYLVRIGAVGDAVPKKMV
jgi:hypothetical protein